MESLLLGIDLGNYHSQISVYNEKKGEIESISPYPEEDEGLIPTVLGVTEDKKTWLYGRECDGREGARIDNLIDTIEQGKGFVIYGVEFSPEAIMEKFIKKLLLLVKYRYPLDNAGKIVLTTQKRNLHLENAIYGGLEKLGIGKDRVSLQTYEESYVSYALGQKRELWKNDVGLFDFNESGLCYKQISFQYVHKPMTVYVIKKDFSDVLSYESLKTDDNDKKEKMAYAFLNLAKETLHKQSVSTVYVTGTGFRSSFADKVLPELCVGRRVFAGQNLYTRGACYKAMELSGKRKADSYIYMSDDIIACNVYLPVYSNAREEYAVLCKFGTPWQKASNEAEVILDEEEEVRIVVNDPLKKQDRTLIIPLGGLPKRPAKMTRLWIGVQFLSESEFVITIKDMGFGTFYKTSNRIWQKQIRL